MELVIIGVDPHKLSATIEVVDLPERAACAAACDVPCAGQASRGSPA
jgi:hypothetical protein